MVSVAIPFRWNRIIHNFKFGNKVKIAIPNQIKIFLQVYYEIKGVNIKLL